MRLETSILSISPMSFPLRRFIAVYSIDPSRILVRRMLYCFLCRKALIKKFERIYTQQKVRGPVSNKAQFEYAWCLVRSESTSKIKAGVVLLEDLFKKASDDMAKRDYLFYAAVGCCKTKEYEKAKKYANAILKVQPGNHQAQQLHRFIEEKMKKDGLLGMAIVGGAAIVGIGALVGLGAALARK